MNLDLDLLILCKMRVSSRRNTGNLKIVSCGHPNCLSSDKAAAVNAECADGNENHRIEKCPGRDRNGCLK